MKRISCLIIVLVACSFAQVNQKQLDQWLKRFPAADTNKDGTLSVEEAMAYRNKATRKPAGRVGAPPAPKVNAGWDADRFPEYAMCYKTPKELAEIYGKTPSYEKPADGALRIVGTGHSFMAPGYKTLPAIVKAAGYKQPPAFTHTGGGATGSARYKWEQENGIFAFKGQAKPKLLTGIANAEWDVMLWGPYFHDRPAYYLCWIEYALKTNPDMRFYLSDAWPQVDQLDPLPKSEKELGPAVIRKLGDEKNAIYADQIGVLRKAHPGKVFVLPTSDAMVLAAEAFHRGELPGVEGVHTFIGKKGRSLWRDRLGHLGPGFEWLEGYVFYATLYQRSPELIEGEVIKAKNGFPSPELDRAFRKIAWQSVTQHPLSGVKDADGDKVGDKISAQDAKPAFKGPIDIGEMLDVSTLDVRIMKDWHRVEGPRGSIATRQKVVNIHVGEVWKGREYRIPVRFVVPAEQKAKGFHLTGGHGLRDFKNDRPPRGIDAELLEGGVGLVQTIVQELGQSSQGELGEQMERKFIETLNPRYSIQYWGWPATLMRAITAAHAETEHVEPGKIAMSGGSKNGATPSSVLIQDKRTTAVHATVSPIWDSPLRLCDKTAWKELEIFNQQYVKTIEASPRGERGDHERLLRHPFLGGTYGPIYNRRALDAGRSWEDLERTAKGMADDLFVSRNLKQLKARSVDMLFHPGTHDFVNFDIAWGGKHHPSIPVYLECNAGHGQRPHPKARVGDANKPAFLLAHFFDDAPKLLAPPTLKHKRENKTLLVSVIPAAGQQPDTGRIWWMFDRGPDGSAAYLRDKFPEEQWAEMVWDKGAGIWAAEIELKDGAKTIDLFSSHGKVLTYKGERYPTAISSPYTRVTL